jgi:hypothetical protein
MTWIFLMFALMTAALIIDFILLVKHERRMDKAEDSRWYGWNSQQAEIKALKEKIKCLDRLKGEGRALKLDDPVSLKDFVRLQRTYEKDYIKLGHQLNDHEARFARLDDTQYRIAKLIEKMDERLDDHAARFARLGVERHPKRDSKTGRFTK